MHLHGIAHRRGERDLWSGAQERSLRRERSLRCEATEEVGQGVPRAGRAPETTPLCRRRATGETRQNERASSSNFSVLWLSLNFIFQYLDYLARGLSQVINIVDPGAIVLGGGVSNMKQIYENINSMLKRYVFSDTVNTKVLKNIHGDSSGVRGAADLGRTNDIN